MGALVYQDVFFLFYLHLANLINSLFFNNMFESGLSIRMEASV